MSAFSRVGLAMRRLRKSKRVPLSELAQKMGYSDPSSVASLEIRNPTATNLGRYLDALGCTVHDLADALDAVNERGAYSPEAKARGHEIAERSSDPYVRDSPDVVASLVRQLERANERLDQLEKQKSPTR